MLRLWMMMFLLLGTLASAVEYGGEKSYLIETPYKVCVVPPQIDEAMEKGIKIVSVKEAKSLYDEGARFYDARDRRHYDLKRIKGAELVKFDESKAEYIVINLPEDKNQALVFYCYGESCANSYEAALAVREKGYTNVNWLLNGFPQWYASEYPTEGK